MQCENDCTEPAHKILTRPADVKESGFAGNGKTKPSQKQRRHVAQRFADGINVAECAGKQVNVVLNRIIAKNKHQNRSDDKAGKNGQKRDD